MSFGEWFLARGVTQAELARRTGVDTGTVSRWVTGKDRPSYESCVKVADALGAALDTVLSVAGHPPRHDVADLDPVVADLVALVRAVDWAKPGRLRSIDGLLRIYRQEDAEDRAATAGEATAGDPP